MLASNNGLKIDNLTLTKYFLYMIYLIYKIEPVHSSKWKYIECGSETQKKTSFVEWTKDKPHLKRNQRRFVSRFITYIILNRNPLMPSTWFMPLEKWMKYEINIAYNWNTTEIPMVSIVFSVLFFVLSFHFSIVLVGIAYSGPIIQMNNQIQTTKT